MPTESIDEYRRNAEECHAQSLVSRRPEDKARWLRLAWDWLALANSTARPDRVDSPPKPASLSGADAR